MTDGVAGDEAAEIRRAADPERDRSEERERGRAGYRPNDADREPKRRPGEFPAFLEGGPMQLGHPLHVEPDRARVHRAAPVPIAASRIGPLLGGTALKSKGTGQGRPGAQAHP